ncbi:MAG: PAS domain S-box protein [Rhodospirillales bacterium]|jgi:PAS domain S-box-containing protein|nr:PAS domain S-box protein [Rhodospirillales bacterium]
MRAQAWYESLLMAEARASVEADLEPYGNGLSAEIYRHVVLLEGLAAFAKSQPAMADFNESFEIFARGLYANGTAFRILQAYPLGAPGLAYPTDGNDAVVGRTLEQLLTNQRPGLQADLRRAIATRQIVLSDPHELRQGGFGVVARRAVYQGDSFWGLVVIVLDMPRVLEAANLAVSPAGLSFALTDRAGRVIGGEGHVLADDPVVREVDLPDGRWHLAMVPDGGWSRLVRGRILPVQIAVAASIGLLTLLTYLLANRHGRLARSVRQRTAELAETHTRYKQLFEHNADAMFVVRRDGRIIDANEAACSIYRCSRDELLGGAVADIVAPHLSPQIKERLEIAIRAPQRLMSCHQRKDGSGFVAEVRTTPVVLGGEPCVLAGVRDVTERDAMERALQESEATLRMVLRSTGEGIFAVDLDGRCTLCNPAAALMLGYHDPADLVGRDIHEMIHHSRADGSALPAKECWIHGVVTRGAAMSGDDGVFWRQDGQPVPVEFWANPVIQNGQVVGATVSFFDIGERKRIEARLRRLSQAVEQSPLGVVITDAQGKYEYVNPAYMRETGYELADLIGKSPAMTDPDGSTRSLIADIEAAVFAGRGWQGERLRRRKDGKLFWASVTAAPIFEENGEIDGFVGFLENITERRRTVEQLRQAHKMQALGQLTGGVAHDFNNILSVILTNAEMLAEDFHGDPASGRLVASIVRSVQRAADLTDRLLAFSRRHDLSPQVLDLEPAVREMAAMWGRSLGELVAVSVQCDADVPPVIVDRGQLETALLNLAVNARDAMPAGGSLTVRVARGQPMAPSGPDGGDAGNFVCIAISDTGTGMPADVVERIFEPFFTTKGKGRGTGLGLSLVYGFIRQSGGDIEVDSVEHAGTTFRIYLPAAEKTATEAEAAKPGEGGKHAEELPPLTILLAEDDEAVRAATRMILTGCGHSVVQAASGHEALEILKRTPKVDLLLTDVVMPGGMSGRDLATAAQQIRADLKVLYTSGHAAGILSDREISSGRVAFIAKPYNRQGLTNALKEVWFGIRRRAGNRGLAPDAHDGLSHRRIGTTTAVLESGRESGNNRGARNEARRR